MSAHLHVFTQTSIPLGSTAESSSSVTNGCRKHRRGCVVQEFVLWQLNILIRSYLLKKRLDHSVQNGWVENLGFKKLEEPRKGLKDIQKLFSE